MTPVETAKRTGVGDQQTPGLEAAGEAGTGDDTGAGEEAAAAEEEGGGLCPSKAGLLETSTTETSSSGDENEERGNWSHKMDFFLSLLGYSVGLSNIWRFPYLCFKNGGGAFLVPYWLCMFLCGIPLFFMEVGLGQFTSRSAVAMWSVGPVFKGMGMATCVIALIVSTYFNVLMAYTVFFLVQSFTFGALPWASCDNWWNTPDCLDYNNATLYQRYLTWLNGTSDDASLELQFANKTFKSPSDEYFHRRVLGLSSGIGEAGGFQWELVLCLLPVWLVTAAGLSKGVKSVGKVVYFTATFPYVVLTILLVRGVTLPGAWEGIRFYLTPDFHILRDPQVWADAAFQVFFSLGPGWGGLVTMGSYNKFHNNCYKDSLMVPVLMGLTSIYAGFVVFSAVGFMAHILRRPVAEVVEKGPGLAFIMYPEVVTKLPGSQLWSILFFVMLFTVGLDSVFVQIETSIAAVWDEMNEEWRRKLKRHHMTFAACAAMLVAGLPFVTRGGMYLLTLTDTYCAVYTVMLVCIAECVTVGWVYGADRFLGDIAVMIGFRPSRFWAFMWRYVSLGIVVVILGVSVLQYDAHFTYGHYVYPGWAVGLGWAIASASLVFIPLGAVWAIAGTPGQTLGQKIRQAFRANSLWGPALKHHRAEWNLQTGPQGIHHKDHQPFLPTFGKGEQLA